MALTCDIMMAIVFLFNCFTTFLQSPYYTHEHVQGANHLQLLNTYFCPENPSPRSGNLPLMDCCIYTLLVYALRRSHILLFCREYAKWKMARLRQSYLCTLWSFSINLKFSIWYLLEKDIVMHSPKSEGKHTFFLNLSYAEIWICKIGQPCDWWKTRKTSTFKQMLADNFTFYIKLNLYDFALMGRDSQKIP
jgi:hypothetical protein